MILLVGHTIDLYCVLNENYTFGIGVRNYLRAVRKGLRTPNGHHKSVSLKRNAVSVYQDLSATTKSPSPPPLSQWERGDKRLPRPLGEGWGEGDKS